MGAHDRRSELSPYKRTQQARQALKARRALKAKRAALLISELNALSSEPQPQPALPGAATAPPLPSPYDPEWISHEAAAAIAALEPTLPRAQTPGGVPPNWLPKYIALTGVESATAHVIADAIRLKFNMLVKGDFRLWLLEAAAQLTAIPFHQLALNRAVDLSEQFFGWPEFECRVERTTKKLGVDASAAVPALLDFMRFRDDGDLALNMTLDQFIISLDAVFQACIGPDVWADCALAHDVRDKAAVDFCRVVIVPTESQCAKIRAAGGIVANMGTGAGASASASAGAGAGASTDVVVGCTDGMSMGDVLSKFEESLAAWCVRHA